MGDPRDRDYAELLVGTCLDVQAGWKVVVHGGILGRPLLEEIVRAVARRDAPLRRVPARLGRAA